MIRPVVEAYRGAVAAYESGRADYPGAIVAALPLASAATLVDLGAGTGKFTRLLAGHGKRVVAVEPLAEMAARLRARLPPGEVEVLEGTAEAIPLPDASADLVCCAQSFHWFDSGPATAEIHRILRPGGHLALIWNVRDESVAWMRELSALWNRHAGDTPRYATGAWRRILQDPRFMLVKEVRESFADRMTPQRLADRVLSVSFMAALPEAEQARVRAELKLLLQRYPELSGQTDFAFPYVSELYLLQRA